MDKFIDGEVITEEYKKRVKELMNDALAAEDEFDLDELERFAAEQRKKEKGYDNQGIHQAEPCRD